MCHANEWCNNYFGLEKVHRADGRWHRFERYIDLGTPGRADGYSYVALDLETAQTISGGVFTSGDCGIDSVLIGHYFARDGVGTPRPWATRFWSELYVDTTPARVEIGDQPVFEDCTHREIQIPTGWSDGRIDVQVNQGTFTAGDTGYVFVVDEHDNASDGYPVVFGDSAEPVCPEPVDADEDGHADTVCGGDDCDDGDPAVHPGAAEPCNGADDDCDGEVDEEFDLSADPANCGSCGHTCAQAQVCSLGECELGCDAGLSDCDGSCVDLMASDVHCGRCERGCGVDRACYEGECVLDCGPGTREQDGVCVPIPPLFGWGCSARGNTPGSASALLLVFLSLRLALARRSRKVRGSHAF
jgi:hypothetical protein